MNKIMPIKHIFLLASCLWLMHGLALGQAVSGKVTDAATHEELIGATVMVKGTTTGSITDFNGVYRIDAPKGSTLVVSYIGKESVEIKVTSNKHDVELRDNSFSIDEVVVVGYGTQKKESVVGAIANIKGDDIAKISGVTNVSNALSGMVPGLTTLNYSGKPGQDDAQLLIRAKSTWNGMEPLILVDGIERDMNNLDAFEIETISVLKDASATAVFGVRGGNGVILVTTKRGRESKPNLRVNANVGMKTVSKMPEFVNSYEARWMRNQAIEAQVPVDPTTWGYITPVAELKHFRDQDLPYQFSDIDWRDEMLRKQVWSQKVNLDIRGGTKFLKYFNSISYLYDGDVLNSHDFGQGYIPKNDYARFNFRSNFDFQPTPTTTFSVDIDGASGKENSMGAEAYLIWPGVYGKGPDDYPIRYEDGTFANNLAGYNMENPVELLNYGGMTTNTRTDINTTFSFKQQLDFVTKGLTLNARVNFQNYYFSEGPNIAASRMATKYIDWRSGNEVWNYPTAYLNSKHGFDFITQKPSITSETAKNNVYQNLMYQTSLDYSRNFKGGHDVTGLFLFKRRESSTGANFPSYREEWAARVTYAYKNTYLFETNGAYNGSEKFDKGHKFGFFPSLAAGWVLSNESFMKPTQSYIDFMKLRYSWGKVGSDNNIPKWLYVSQWKQVTNSAKVGYPQAGVPPYTSYDISNIGNPDARWETATKNDIAFEGIFLSNLLSVNFDYYWGNRVDIFMSAEQRNIPPWFGADPVAANIGQTKEHGWELELKFKKSTYFKLNYFASAAISYAKDEVIYREDPFLLPSYQKNEGYQIGQTRSYLNEGVIQSWDEMYTGVMWLNNPQSMPGNFRQIDYNADGYIDANDWVPYGYPDHPQYTMNFTVGADYKGFSLMMQLYGTTNSTLAEWVYEYSGPYYASVIERGLYNDVWLPGYDKSGSYKQPSFMYSANSNGNYFNKDGTMWRLKNVELAYQFHPKMLKEVGINSLRLYVNGYNLWLFSHLNEDRETGGIRNTHDHAVKYPMTKTVNAGLNIVF